MDLHEHIITGFRVNGINDMEPFVAIDDNLEDLKITRRDGIGVDPSTGGLPHKVALPKP